MCDVKATDLSEPSSKTCNIAAPIPYAEVSAATVGWIKMDCSELTLELSPIIS